MNKLLLALLLISNVASAGDYAEATNTRKLCTSMGAVAGMAFDAKGRGEPIETMLAKSEKYPPKVQKDFKVAAEIGYERTDKKDAHMAAWASCMDTYSGKSSNW